MSDKREAIKERLNKVFQEVFDDDEIQIHDDMTAEDIDEWDSLMHVSLVVAAENEFGIEVNAVEIGNLKNVGAMIDLFLSRGIV